MNQIFLAENLCQIS